MRVFHVGAIVLAAALWSGGVQAAPTTTLVGRWAWNPALSVSILAPPERFLMTVERDDPAYMAYTVEITRGGKQTLSRFSGPVDGRPHPLEPSGEQTVTRLGEGRFHIVSVAGGVRADRVCALEADGAKFVCRGEASMGERHAPYVDSFDRQE